MVRNVAKGSTVGTPNYLHMSAEEFRATWRALTPDERRFVRTVAAVGETAGSTAGNTLVAAYAARRLRLLRSGAQALVTLGWMAYLVTAFTVLQETPTTVLTTLAVVFAAAQAAWVVRAENRLRHTISVNR